MDEYNELHTYSRRLVEAATDAAEMGKSLKSHLDDLDNMLLNQERLNGETQEAVMRTRMVPVKTVFPRLQRSVRQTCRLTGKCAELHLAGGETLMDSDVLQAMVDPLMHLLRNAIDHGIEEPQMRGARGKSNSGQRRLEFGRDGNNILIRCADDGAGLDFAAIRDAAHAAGLIARGPQPLGRRAQADHPAPQLLDALFGHADFRPRHRARCGQLARGRARRCAQPGFADAARLHRVELRLPVSLISSHALLVRVGPYRLSPLPIAA